MSASSASSASATVKVGQNLRFKIGWIILLLSAVLMILNHIVLFFVLDNPALYLGWAAFNLYAFLVICIPLRRLEKWAWYATWILPIGLAVTAFTNPDIAVYYYAVSAACVLGLLLTMLDFFAAER